MDNDTHAFLLVCDLPDLVSNDIILLRALHLRLYSPDDRSIHVLATALFAVDSCVHPINCSYFLLLNMLVYLSMLVIFLRFEFVYHKLFIYIFIFLIILFTIINSLMRQLSSSPYVTRRLPLLRWKNFEKVMTDALCGYYACWLYLCIYATLASYGTALLRCTIKPVEAQLIKERLKLECIRG